MSDMSRYATDEAIRQMEVQAVNFPYHFIEGANTRSRIKG